MTSKVNFRIKLLSGDNIVLVEANGYESEIFMPHIVNGRVTFLNVIPNRRCCLVNAHSKSGRNPLRVKSETQTPDRMAQKEKLARFSAGSDKENNAQSMRPLAMSTPACGGKRSVSNVRVKAGTSSCMTSGLQSDSTLPTPDLARRAAPLRSELAVENPSFNLPRGIKVMRLYHSSPNGTPRKLGRIVSTSKGDSNKRQELLNFSRMIDLGNSFAIGSSPQMDGMTASTPINNRLLKVAQQRSAAKWRKCITPKKTYSRKGNHAIPKHDKSFQSARKCVKPSYLANPTMAPKAALTVEMKKRHLKVDKMVRIPSKVMKKRRLKDIKQAESVSNTEYMKNSLQHIAHPAMSAFDLLTNCNRTRCISKKLNEQFRRGCVNKASSTYPKYRVLSTVPPLEEDAQVLRLRPPRPHQSNSQQPIESAERQKSSQILNSATSTTSSMPISSHVHATGVFLKPNQPTAKKAFIHNFNLNKENEQRHNDYTLIHAQTSNFVKVENGAKRPAV